MPGSPVLLPCLNLPTKSAKATHEHAEAGWPEEMPAKLTRTRAKNEGIESTMNEEPVGHTRVHLEKRRDTLSSLSRNHWTPGNQIMRVSIWPSGKVGSHRAADTSSASDSVSSVGSAWITTQSVKSSTAVLLLPPPPATGQVPPSPACWKQNLPPAKTFLNSRTRM